MSLNVLLLSPYDALSHQYWRERLVAGLVHGADAVVTVVTLPARYFSWRFRGNSLTLSQDERLDSEFDLIIATSMTDFATLLGLKPQLARVPSILYFHENQFAYPDHQRERQVERQITSIYSALAADQLVFNTGFNRETFLSGVAGLLKKMPDGVPMGVEQVLRDKSHIIAVPIDQVLDQAIKPQSAAPDEDQCLTIVWNHRWEHDKGLEALKQVVLGLLATRRPFRFHLIGQQFRTKPKLITEIEALLGDKLGQFGYIEDRAEYLRLLAASDVVLSTARHEFQGVAVLEAIAAGAIPVVPDDLAYRELVPAHCRYESVEAAVSLILAQRRQVDEPVLLPPEVTHNTVNERWLALIGELTQKSRLGP